MRPIAPPKAKRHVYARAGFKAVVFDLYGTLLISKSGDVEGTKIQDTSLLHIFRKNGFAFSAKNPEEGLILKLGATYKKTIDEHKSQLKTKGLPYPEINIVRVWEDIVGGLQSDGSLAKAGHLEPLIIEFECATNPTYPMPDLKELIECLYKNNFIMGTISNAQFYTPLLMDYFFRRLAIVRPYSELFPQSLCMYSYELGRAKPDPYAFEVLANRLREQNNLNPKDVLYVGNDMLKDVRPANEVGFSTALFAGDERSLRLREGDDLVSGLQPNFTLTSLKDVLEIVGLPST